MKPLHIHYIMTHGIGDVIMTLPVVREILEQLSAKFSITVFTETEEKVIRELFPDQEFAFIHFRDILVQHNHFSASLLLIKKIRAFAPDIILTQFDISAFKSNLISFFSGAKKRIGWKGPFSFLNTTTLVPSGAHKLIENLKVLGALGIPVRRETEHYPIYNFNPAKFENRLLKNLLSNNRLRIVVGPGSKELDKHKRWPASSFSQLIDRIFSLEEEISVILVGDQHERDLCQMIESHVKNNKNLVNLAGQLEISELLALLAKTDLTIANCNGVSHMAGAAQSPVIGLYGPTNYKFTGLLTDNFFPISAGLDCSPCFARDYETGCGNPVCMERITVEQVFKIVQNVLFNRSVLPTI